MYSQKSKNNSLVAFYKLANRQLHPKVKSRKQLLTYDDLADNYLKKHISSLDFENMVERNVDKFLINKV